MIRAVLDTNIVVSGLFWKGLPRVVFDAALDKQYILLSSEALAAELKRVLAYQKFAQQLVNRGLDVEMLVNRYQSVAIAVMPAEIPPNVVRDPKDQAVLACAVGGKAEFIVSGDKDLLTLTTYQDIPILNAEQFLQHLTSP